MCEGANRRGRITLSSRSPGQLDSGSLRGAVHPAAVLDLGPILHSSSEQSRTHQLMLNIWWISHVRPIRAELTDPNETEFCSCSPHSNSPRSTFLLLLLLLAVFSSVLSSCQSNGPSRSGNIYFLFRCSSSDVGSYRVVFIRWEDN